MNAVFEAARYLELSCRHAARLAREMGATPDRGLRELMRAAFAQELNQISLASEALARRAVAETEPASASPSL